MRFHRFRIPVAIAGLALITVMMSRLVYSKEVPGAGIEKYNAAPTKNHVQFPRQQSKHFQDVLARMSPQAKQEATDLLTNFERNDAKPNFHQISTYIFEIGSSHGARVLLVKDNRNNPHCKYKSPPNTYNVVGMYQATGDSNVDTIISKGFTAWDYDPWNYGPPEPRWPNGCYVPDINPSNPPLPEPKF